VFVTLISHILPIQRWYRKTKESSHPSPNSLPRKEKSGPKQQKRAQPPLPEGKRIEEDERSGVTDKIHEA